MPRFAGVVICLRFGAAFNVFTAPALRGTGAELEMLQSAFDTTSRHMPYSGPGELWVITDVCVVFDHIAQRDLREPIPAPELPGGFFVRPAEADDGSEPLHGSRFREAVRHLRLQTPCGSLIVARLSLSFRRPG
jgi:hypothetical protein